MRLQFPFLPFPHSPFPVSPFSVLSRSSARRPGPAAAILLGALVCFAAAAGAQTTISGTVVIGEDREPAHQAEVILIESNRITHTDDDGRFSFEAVEDLGVLTLHADLGYLSGSRVIVVEADQGSVFELAEPILMEAGHRTHERITVTASIGESSPFEAFGAVQSFEGLDLHNESARTVAELLEGAPGIAVRSFGPGSARPIVRGFDGDRVLVMEDGVRTGDLASQSGDHGVPADPLQAERVEVVRGPATLLYGSNAIGGAVNVISMGSHLAHGPPEGFRGQANLDYSTADEGVRGGVRAQAAGNGWFAWGGGNANRTGDYESPVGAIENSARSMSQGEGGFGLFGERGWISASTRFDDSRYGIPFVTMFGHGHGEEHEEEDGEEHEEEDGEEHEEEDGEEDVLVDVAMNRRQFRTDFGLHDLGSVFEEAEFTVRYSDYEHDELETPPGGPDEVGTHFDNESLVFRGELKKTSGRILSRVGVWGNLRSYEATGHEALAPRTRQNALAAFAYNEIRAGDRFGLLLGARLERNAYDVTEIVEAEEHEEHDEDEHDEHEGEEEEHEEDEHERHEPVRDREFLGASASAGARFLLSDRDALVATASYATRAPSLEELYNFGPHPGNVAFEIGNPSLDPERSLGVDLSLRRDSGELTGAISLFRYSISDFIFGADEGEREGALPVLDFHQAAATYQGFEVEGHLEIGPAELTANASYVDARLTGTDEYVPRIPPLGGKVKLDVPVGRLRLAPKLRWAARMDRLYRGETATDGYAVLDFTASWVFVAHHTTSNLSFQAYNLTNAEYRHHTSLIKEYAPLIGRGFRIAYSLHFF